MKYLRTLEIIEINRMILGDRAGIRDMAMLESAVARPQASAFASDAYPTITDKASALLHSLILNHPFVDGNKRTGIISMIEFLSRNNYSVIWEKEEALEFIIEVAEGKHDVDSISKWLHDRIRARA